MANAAMDAVWAQRSKLDLVGTHVDAKTGQWVVPVCWHYFESVRTVRGRGETLISRVGPVTTILASHRIRWQLFLAVPTVFLSTSSKPTCSLMTSITGMCLPL